MLDPGTILAVVGLIIQVAGSVDKVIVSFDRLQNAPQELRHFQTSVARLQRNFEIFKNNVASSEELFALEDIKEIKETLQSSEEFFNKYKEQRKGIVTGVLRTTWSLRDNPELAKLKLRIDRHFSQILVPVSLQLIM
jgi:hypothetical protein